MNHPFLFRVAAVALTGWLSVSAHAEDASAARETAAISPDDMAAISDRIRQTGAQMQADLKKARARLEADKTRHEAERREQIRLAALRDEQQRAREAAQEKARQEVAERAEAAERQRQEAARKQAERVAELAAVRKSTQTELAAREAEGRRRAAEALRQARESTGPRAFGD